MDAFFPPLIARLPAEPVTRFAPAPTGWLHLGHVLNAYYIWEIARAIDGRVLLRIEDHDRTRARPEFEAGILDDLDWLGFHPDIYTTDQFRAGRCDGRQSDRDSVYREAFEILRNRGLVYACDCSRASVESRSRRIRPDPGGSRRSRPPPGPTRGLPANRRSFTTPVTAGTGSSRSPTAMAGASGMDSGVEFFDDARLGDSVRIRRGSAATC